MTLGYILGKTSNRFSYIVSDTKPFIDNMFLIIEDTFNGDIPCEVIENTAIPFATNSALPDGADVEFVSRLGLDTNKPLFIAKIKTLKPLTTPIFPASPIRQADFNEVSKYVTNAKIEDSFVLGIIKGSESTHDTLPDKLKDVAPLWKEGSAIDQLGIPLFVNYRKFREYPHIGIFGSSGSGKSFATKVLLEEIMKLNIPAIVFDPHNEVSFTGDMENLKEKFRHNYSSVYKEFEIGVNLGIKFESLDIGELINLLSFIDVLTEPQKSALDVLFKKGMSIDELIQDINLLKNAFEEEEKNKYGKRVKHYDDDEDDVDPNATKKALLYQKCKNSVSGIATLQALGWKCTSLKNKNIFISDIKDVEDTLLNRKVAIIRGSIAKLKMISSYLLAKLYKKRRIYVDKKNPECFFPPFFAFFDEAQNFAPNGSKSNPCKSLLITIGQEARKYGVYLCLSTQRPSNLDESLVAQLNTKFIFRLVNKEDMEMAQVEGNLTALETSTLPDLPSGNCFASSAILPKTYPVIFRTTFSKAGESTDVFNELNICIGQGSYIENFILNNVPINVQNMGMKMQGLNAEVKKMNSNNNVNVTFDVRKLKTLLNSMVKSGMLINTGSSSGLFNYEKP